MCFFFYKLKLHEYKMLFKIDIVGVYIYIPKVFNVLYL